MSLRADTALVMAYEYMFDLPGTIGTMLVATAQGFWVAVLFNGLTEMGLVVFSVARARRRRATHRVSHLERSFNADKTSMQESTTSSGRDTAFVGDILNKLYCGQCSQLLILTNVGFSLALRLALPGPDLSGALQMTWETFTQRYLSMAAVSLMVLALANVVQRCMGVRLESLPPINALNQTSIIFLCFGGWCAYLLSLAPLWKA